MFHFVAWQGSCCTNSGAFYFGGGSETIFETTLIDVIDFFTCGRWGEVEIEKGPVDLFPTEPTDEDRQVEETLNPGFKELLGL